MPARRELTMRQIRQMLRLARDGVSAREIGRTLGVARSTIQDNLKRAAAAGLTWPLPGELTDDEKAEQKQRLTEAITGFDVVITTAAIPGQPAPVLITEEMARSMKPGSVIVDLVAERGGNCALTVPGDVRREDGVTVIGYTDFPSRMAEQASQLYARTVWNLLSSLWGEEGIRIDLEDDIVGAAALVHGGADRRGKTGGPQPAPASSQLKGA